MSLDAGVWVTLADLKEHLDIESSDTSKDSFLTNKLNGAWKNLVSYLGQDLTQTTYTEDYDGDGDNSIILEHFPVISITSVYSDFSRAWQNDPFGAASANTLIDATTYFCELKTGLLRLFNGAVFASGFGNIHVIYSAGYTIVPYDAKEALLEYTAYIAQRAGVEGRVAQTLGGKSEQYDLAPIPLYVRQMIINYRKIPC